MNKKILIGVLIGIILCGLVFLWLNLDKKEDTNITKDESIKITKGGEYTLSSDITDGNVIIDTNESVKLILNGITIKNSNGPAILVLNAKEVEIELVGINTLEDGTTYSTDYTDYNAVIYSKDNLIISGNGTLKIKANNKDAITSKDNLTIKDGTYIIEAIDDGIHGKDSLTILNGNFTIKSDNDGIRSDGIITIEDGTLNITALEGIEATYVKINGGNINIAASDDGINAANKSDEYSATVEINGGNITIKMGEGDTDGVDSNGDIIINGGTISVTGQSTFDYDGEGKINGGTVICNGEEVTTLPNQFMGGPGDMNGDPGNMPQQPPNDRRW